MDSDPRVALPAARAWNELERALSVLEPSAVNLPDRLFDETATADHGGPNTPYFEWHYIRHDCFLEPSQLVANADRLAGIPGIIVQGRYDLLCPPRAASGVADRWPDCDLRIVADAGHTASEPSIRDGLLAAIQDIATPATERL